MAILVNRESRVLVQGITGHEGSFHASAMLDFGTQVVAGVTPGKGGQTFKHGDHIIPVFNTVFEAVEQTGADVSCIFVPPVAAGDAAMEASDAGCSVIVAITEGIPVLDAVKQYSYVTQMGATLIGPNCPGLVSAGECKVGIMPARIFSRGPVGLISRSGTLTYEVVNALTEAGIGQTTCIGIGEIGGSDEEEAAEYVQEEFSKPVVGFISGRTAPEGKRMGHAGAIVSGNTGTAASKVAAFEAAGIRLADLTMQIPGLVKEVLGK